MDELVPAVDAYLSLDRRDFKPVLVKTETSVTPNSTTAKTETPKP